MNSEKSELVSLVAACADKVQLLQNLLLHHSWLLFHHLFMDFYVFISCREIFGFDSVFIGFMGWPAGF